MVEPVGNVAVEMLALVPITATVPNVVVPALKVTVPNGFSPVDEVTVAVKVTLCPDEDGFADDLSTVLVEAGFTTWFKTGEVLIADASSPRYSAVNA